MLSRFLPSAWQQQRLLKQVTNPVALHYLQTPLPDKNALVQDVEFVTLDFETTGLNAKQDAILSMGYAHVKHGRVVLRDAQHDVIRVNIPLPAETVVIHKITDDRMNEGMPLHEALDTLVSHMAGRVLLVHYAPIERYFLKAAMLRVYGVELPFLMVDTLDMAHKRITRQQQVIAPNQLRLANLREAHHLPRSVAHHALEDAIATAELFLVELALKGDGIRLKQVLAY